MPGRKVERTTWPCRPPLLTHVCQRGGRPPSAFRLLPCGSPPGACTPARVDRAGPPILRCWIKIGRPAPASQKRSGTILSQMGEGNRKVWIHSGGAETRRKTETKSRPEGAGEAEIPPPDNQIGRAHV